MTDPGVDVPERQRPSLVVATAIALALPLIGAVMRAVGSQPGELADAPLAPLALAAVVGGPGVLALAARRRPALYLPAGLLCVPVAVLSVVTLPLAPTGLVLLTGTRLRRGIRGA